MTIKTILDAYGALKGISSAEFLESQELVGAIRVILNELTESAEVARKTVLESTSEEEFVKLMLMIQKLCVAMGASDGDANVLMADLSGELQTYTHTVILATIGVLINEEIL